MPSHAGRGHARALLDRLEQEAHEMGAIQIELDVAAGNARAIRFYERAGFRRTGIKPRAVLIEGRFEDDVSYVKDLDTTPAR